MTVAGGTFRWAIGEPTSILPPMASTTDDFAVVDALFDSLTTAGVAGRPAPSAATEWSANDDATVWTFHLRPGATFQDGTPVTAEAFVEAWSTLVAAGPMQHLLRDVVGHAAVVRGAATTLSGMRATSADTLEVTLSRPRGDFPILTSHPSLGPVQPSAVAADPAAHALQPVGNGPFRASEPWVPGEFVRAARWDGWTNGDRPEDGVGEVVFRIADLDTNFLAFRQGRRDLARVPPEALELAAEEYPASPGSYTGPGLVTGATPETYLLAIDRSVEPYEELEVREAASLFVDRQRIAAENDGGNLDPATSLLPPAISRGSAGMCELCTFNPSGAADRLADAGVPGLTLAFNAEGGHERIRDVLREALSDRGYTLVSNWRGAAPTLVEYLDRLASGGIGMFRLPLTADVPSSLDILYPLLHSSQTPDRGGLNYMRYQDPQVDALLDQAAQIVDVDQREALLRRVEEIVVNRDQVIVPVVTSRLAVVVGEDVTGVRVDPFGGVDLTTVRAV